MELTECEQCKMLVHGDNDLIHAKYCAQWRLLWINEQQAQADYNKVFGVRK